MKKKTIILYDLQDKTQTEKTQALRKLFGYRDKSNYNYEYERQGELNKIQLKRYKKAIIEIQNDKDLSKVTEILNKLKIKHEIAKTR